MSVARTGMETPAPVVQNDSSVPDAGTPDQGTNVDTGGPPAATATLTVMNFLSWCSVTINAGAASTAASVTASVAVGSTATMVVTPASAAFTIGPTPWFGVTENGGGAAAGVQQGSGTGATSTATVVVTGNQCVSVCCQEPGNSPIPCPTTNPCP
ncbi:MAG: hypothetical protein QOI41_3440 [Myxococcales bacterium]|nr:hypothetical protein [Myxococcales bacterium]